MQKYLKYIVLSTIVFALLTILFKKANLSNIYLKSDISNLINYIENYDVLFNEKLIELKYGVINNYDYNDREQKNIDEDLSILKNLINKNFDSFNRYKNNFLKKIEKYNSLINKRKIILEEFKSEHAVLSNSIMVFPDLASSTLKYLIDNDEHFDIELSLKALFHNILLYHYASKNTLDISITVYIDRLRFMRDQFPPPIAHNIEMLIAHAQIILEKKPLEHQLFSELLSLPTIQLLSGIRRSHHEFYSRLEQEAAIYRIFLYIFSLLLLVYVVYILYRLKLNTQSLYASNTHLEHEIDKRKQVEADLHDANAQLETRVAERTHDLEHSNAQLQSEILERRATEAALRASETRYRALVEGSLQGISIISMAGKRLFANVRLVEILGYANLDDYMRHDPKTNIAPHEVKRLSGYRDAFRKGAPSLNFYEYEGRRADGTPIWLERLVTPITWDGEAALFSSIVDITERKQAETEHAKLQRELLEASRQAGMAEVATGILHNVGNVLNSVTTAASLAVEGLHQSRVVALVKAAALLDTHRDDLGTFITSDPQGQHLPPFLHHLAQHLLDERNALLDHLQVVNDKVDHIKEIVALQQSYATASGVIEPLALAALMDDALQTHDDSFGRHEVEVVRAYAELPLVLTDRHKVLQILVNLISNAKQALLAADSTPKQLTVRVRAEEGEQVVLEVADNGVGIEAANLTRIFQHGFTTKSDGHGFGLHSSALMAQELGGTLTAHSAGVGQGAVFRLAFPMQEAQACRV